MPIHHTPLSGAIGAEIHGIDLARATDAEIAEIRQIWLAHNVVFFRGQTLPPADFLALARRFGTPIEYPFVKGIEGFPEIIPVLKLPHEKVNFGGIWHSDTTYLEQPPMGSMLLAREVLGKLIEAEGTGNIDEIIEAGGYRMVSDEGPIREAIQAALADPEVMRRLAELGAEPMPSTQPQFLALIEADRKRWGDVIRAADIRVQ